jgi:hypothetical protein
VRPLPLRSNYLQCGARPVAAPAHPILFLSPRYSFGPLTDAHHINVLYPTGGARWGLEWGQKSTDYTLTIESLRTASMMRPPAQRTTARCGAFRSAVTVPDAV